MSSRLICHLLCLVDEVHHLTVRNAVEQQENLVFCLKSLKCSELVQHIVAKFDTSFVLSASFPLLSAPQSSSQSVCVLFAIRMHLVPLFLA